jgi:hypothetical protein
MQREGSGVHGGYDLGAAGHFRQSMGFTQWNHLAVTLQGIAVDVPFGVLAVSFLFTVDCVLS